MASPGHIIAVTFLDVLGLCMNAWFLYTVKARQSPYNAIDVLQATKTLLVILALLSSVWLDLITCSHGGSYTGPMACIGSKAIIENLFFHSMCYTFLTVACIRRKVCKCRGRADVLITTRYAFKSLLLTFMPVGMFVAATVSLVSNYSTYTHDVTFEHDDNTTVDDDHGHVVPNNMLDLFLGGHSGVIYQICHTLVLNLIPLITSFVIYINIVYTVRETADKTDGFISQRNRSPTKVITMSVAVLLTCTCSLWTIYSISAIVAIFVEVDQSVFTFLKLTILIVHPFGEGLLQPSSRNPGAPSGRFLRERSSRQVCPESSPSLSSFRDERGTHQLSEFLPALIEERESALQSHSSNQSQVQTESKEELQVLKRRRPSIFHPRPSVLMRNAPTIGLEYRDEPNVVSLVKTRRESEERLKEGLKAIDDDEARQTSYRKLSNCLRLSSPAEINERDVYEEYRKRYFTKTEKRKESKTSTPSHTCVEEYKGLRYATNNQVDKGASTSNSLQRKRSQKRWWKLLKTAQTANRFSKHQRTDATTIEESSNENAFSTDEDIMRRISRDSKKQTTSQGRKKRSISTSKNYWLESMDSRPPSVRGRNKSVSFISNIVVDDDIRGACPRSFSYDAQISVNYKNNDVDLGLKHKKRSEGNTERRGKASSSVWTVTGTTTREECIEKLQEWKAYF